MLTKWLFILKFWQGKENFWKFASLNNQSKVNNLKFMPINQIITHTKEWKEKYKNRAEDYVKIKECAGCVHPDYFPLWMISWMERINKSNRKITNEKIDIIENGKRE